VHPAINQLINQINVRQRAVLNRLHQSAICYQLDNGLSAKRF